MGVVFCSSKRQRICISMGVSQVSRQGSGTRRAGKVWQECRIQPSSLEADCFNSSRIVCLQPRAEDVVCLIRLGCVPAAPFTCLLFRTKTHWRYEQRWTECSLAVGTVVNASSSCIFSRHGLFRRVSEVQKIAVPQWSQSLHNRAAQRVELNLLQRFAASLRARAN